MLKENIKVARKNNGLSQEELAIKLNVVRQTVSKWEQGLSVPDSEMLISISETLNTPVSTLLGGDIAEYKGNDLQAISEKLEAINLQLARKKEIKRKTINYLLIALSIIIVLIYLLLFLSNSFYLDLDYNDSEYAVLGVTLHSFEWLFVRVAPFVLIGIVIGIFLNRKKK